MSSFYIDTPFVHLWNRKNRPFQAQYEKMLVRKLATGQTSQQIKTGMLYRDTSGRTRREEFSDSEIPHDKFSGTAIVSDAAKQELYFLDVGSKTFLRSQSSGAIEEATDEEVSDLLKDAASKGTVIGKQIIEGFVCHGYRIDQPEGSVIEYWISEELSDVLLAKSESTKEEIILRLFSIRRVEPDSSLFTAPIDYQDEEG
jgi:hypothetical protein